MRFSKKILVLKQICEGYSLNGKPVSGILRAEIEDGVASLHLSPVNFRAVSGGSYRLFFRDGTGLMLSYGLGLMPAPFHVVIERVPDLSRGASAGICYVSEDIPTLIAFQRSEDSQCDVCDFKRAVADKCLNDRKNRLKELAASEREETESINACPPKEEPQTTYDDEAVATENYFELDEDISDKLNLIKDLDYEYVRTENELPYNGDKKETQEIEGGYNRREDEAASGSGDEYSEERRYVDTVREELEDMFLKFPEENSLKNVFPDCRFVRINYSADKYYVAGVIKEKGREKYICYGVPSPYSERAPKELAPYCSFIPLSVFDLSGDGYWMMFQSAATGECIKLSDKR